MTLSLAELYPASVNSVATVTVGALNSDTTTFDVLDSSVLPDAPNLLVIGQDQTAETVLLTAKNGNTLTVTRGVQGTAKAWQSGVQIARNFTAKDWNDIISNFSTATNYLENLSAADIGAVPTDRTINDKALTSDITLSASDVGAAKNTDFISGGSFVAMQNDRGDTWYRMQLNSNGNTTIYQSTDEGVNWTGIGQLARGSFLPLDGSVAMSGGVSIAIGEMKSVMNVANGNNTGYHMVSKGNDIAEVLINPVEKWVRFVTSVNNGGTWTGYDIYHGGNKPSGSYTGNGSATTNPLSLDVQKVGIGKAMFITSNNGSAIVTPNGAILFNGTTVTTVPSSQAKYTPLVITKNSDGTETRSGGLALVTTNTILNANGVSYNYFAL